MIEQELETLVERVIFSLHISVSETREMKGTGDISLQKQKRVRALDGCIVFWSWQAENYTSSREAMSHLFNANSQPIGKSFNTK